MVLPKGECAICANCDGPFDGTKPIKVKRQVHVVPAVVGVADPRVVRVAYMSARRIMDDINPIEVGDGIHCTIIKPFAFADAVAAALSGNVGRIFVA